MELVGAQETNLRGTHPKGQVPCSYFPFFVNSQDGTTFTQPAIRGQEPQEIYSL
jgi:hypothetical protein